MANFILLGVCLCVGLFLKHGKKVPREAAGTINQIVFHLSMPAMTLLHFHEVRFGYNTILPVLSPWVLFIVSVGFFELLGGLSKKLPKGKSFEKHFADKKTLGALILTSGFANTSFVGFPLLEALYGKHSIQTGIIVDQLGSFPILSTLGMFAASYYSAESFTFSKMVRRVIFFPPFLAMILAISLRSIPYPPGFTEFLERVGGTLTPLSLISVGLQLELKTDILKTYSKPLLAGLVFKLLLGPLCVSFLYAFFFLKGAPYPQDLQIAIAEAAMAPMITAAVIASEFRLKPELAHLMVGIGIPLSFITVPLWVHFLR